MKRKIIAVILLVVLTASSLSSCLLLDESMLIPSSGLSGGGDTTINVTGGTSYGDINITSTHEKNLLAASKAVLSSVSVICRFEEYQYNSNGSYSGKTKETASAGSGVIYKLDKQKGEAYVITNYHVVYNAKSTNTDGISRNINLYLYGMENMAEGEVSYAIPATFVGGSMNYDIAVLKVTASTVLMGSNAKQVEVADSDKVSILDTAIAVGNPGGGGLSATVGNINVDSENILVKFETQNSTATVQLRVMRTDAAVNSGNSGGGLFNDSGELIGIVNAKDADTSTDNIGYAIPSNVAAAIAENAMHYKDGTVKRCLLGITVGVKSYSTNYDEKTGKIYKLEQVVVTELSDDAFAKGYLNEGDVINSITVDGKKHEVTRIFHVVDSMLWARVGSAVKINITDKSGVTKDIEFNITEKTLKVS